MHLFRYDHTSIILKLVTSGRLYHYLMIIKSIDLKLQVRLDFMLLSGQSWVLSQIVSHITLFFWILSKVSHLENYIEVRKHIIYFKVVMRYFNNIYKLWSFMLLFHEYLKYMLKQRTEGMYKYSRTSVILRYILIFKV